jgi:hypothetical protein
MQEIGSQIMADEYKGITTCFSLLVCQTSDIRVVCGNASKLMNVKT